MSCLVVIVWVAQPICSRTGSGMSRILGTWRVAFLAAPGMGRIFDCSLQAIDKRQPEPSFKL